MVLCYRKFVTVTLSSDLVNNPPLLNYRKVSLLPLYLGAANAYKGHFLSDYIQEDLFLSVYFGLMLLKVSSPHNSPSQRFFAF